jgi:membrane glycosyltransferase
MSDVVMEMTALAKMSQVIESIVLFIPIQVCGCKNYFTSGFRMWLIILCPAERELWRAFASVAAPLSDQPDN